MSEPQVKKKIQSKCAVYLLSSMKMSSQVFLQELNYSVLSLHLIHYNIILYIYIYIYILRTVC